jgi:hypothetical protein
LGPISRDERAMLALVLSELEARRRQRQHD